MFSETDDQEIYIVLVTAETTAPMLCVLGIVVCAPDPYIVIAAHLSIVWG